MVLFNLEHTLNVTQSTLTSYVTVIQLVHLAHKQASWISARGGDTILILDSFKTSWPAG